MEIFVTVSAAMIFWSLLYIKEIWTWLKGSRKSYYLDDGIIRELEPGEFYRGTISTTIIEIRTTFLEASRDSR